MRRGFSWIALVLAIGLSLATHNRVVAHAFLSRSDPEDGAVLADFPHEVRLWFSEPVVLDFTRVELTNSAGQSMPVTSVRLEAANLAEVVVALPHQPPDAYRLTWHTLSADDVHPSTGTLVFGIQQSATVAEAILAPPAMGEVVWRWLNFAGLSVLLGALAMVLMVVPPVAELDSASTRLYRTIRPKLLALALGGGLMALVSGVGLVWTQAQTISGAEAVSAVLQNAVRLLTDTAYGGRWWQRQGLLLEMVIAVGVLWRRPIGEAHRSTRFNARTVEFVVLGPFALLLIVTQALNSHAAGVSDVTWVSIALEALHLLAATMWSGGLLALATIIAPLLWHNLETSTWAWAVLRRFGGLATACVAVLAVTGLYALGQQVASPDALVATAYGRTLLIKVGLIMGVGLVGLFNSAMLHPRVARLIRRMLLRPVNWKPFSSTYLWQTVTVEALGLGALLLAAALLGATPPARGPEFDPPPESAPSTYTTEADDLLVTFSIRPNRPGQNFISLGVFNTRRPAPAPIETITVQFQPSGRPAQSFIAEPEGDTGQYQLVGDVITQAGEWQIMVTVQRTGLADTTVSTPWTVFPPLPSARRPVMLSNQPLGPWTTVLAVGVAVGFGLAVVWWRRTKRKPASPSSATNHP